MFEARLRKCMIVFFSLFAGRVTSLPIPANPILRHNNFKVTPSAAKHSNRKVEMRCSNGDSYKYVHPAIREVLVMDAESLGLGAGGTTGKGTILVNAHNYTLKWSALEELIISEKEDQKSRLVSDQLIVRGGYISVKLLVILAYQSESAIFREIGRAHV